MLLTALILGAYLSRRVEFNREDGESFATVRHQQIWNDLIALFTLIGTVCGKFVDFSRASRQYFNAELHPWLERRGIKLELPTIDLPRLPGQHSELAQ